MRLGKLPPRSGDLRADARNELRWAMGGAGLTIEKLLVMDSVRHLPVVARALAAAGPSAVPRAALDALTDALRELGDGLHARLLRNSFAVDYAGSAKDLTARRVEFVRQHNDAARASGSRNLLPESPRALYDIEQQVLETLVTALGVLPDGTVVADEPAPRAPASRVAALDVPRQLPAAPARFGGRADVVAWLDANAFGAGSEPGAPAVVAVHGTAGVGKTALALHWAHRVAERFPDGQLYVDLRGHSRDGAPVAPVTALSLLLSALGVAPDGLPADEERLAGAYRSVTAGKRLLVVLDNAAGTEQIVPLVPGEPRCTVLVTSRNALPGLAVALGAAMTTLEALPPEEAVALFAALLGTERTGAEPDATGEVAALCGFLPLAMRIVAAKLQAEPGGTLAGMAERLRRSDRLTALGFGEDGEVAVRSAFELSYDSLEGTQQRAFRLLGLVPGPDVTAAAAAALLDTDEGTAGHLLDRLAAGHLVGRADGRYQLHDLLREYAHERCVADDDADTRESALARLLAYYAYRTTEATLLLHAGALRLDGDLPDVPPPPSLADRDAAVTWLSRERQNLSAAVVQAAAAGLSTPAWQLAYAMRSYFLVGLSGADWLAVGAAGLDAATRAGHHAAASAMHGLLGRAYRQVGDLPAAERHVEQALATSRQATWPEGEAIAHCTLGGILENQGRFAEAIAHHQAALELERRDGGARGSGHLGSIAGALCQIGRYADAAGYVAEALDIAGGQGDERSVAMAYERLGVIHHQAGRLDDAAADLDRALAAYRRLDFTDLEAECLADVARLRCDAGDLAGGRECAEESLRLARELSDGRIEVVALNTLGHLALCAGDPDDAAAQYAAAVDLARGIGYRLGGVAARAGLAATAVAAGDHARGCALAADVADEARRAGFLALEAQASTVLCSALAALGDRAGARQAGERALGIHRSCGCLLGAAHVEALLTLVPRAG